MRPKLIKRVLLLSAVIGLPLLAYTLLPFGLPPAERYFEQPPQRTLQPDEIGQMRSVQETYLRLSLRGDDFEYWNTARQDFWKYSIAFAMYGIPSAIIINPEKTDEYKALMDMMIWAMKSKKVWGDFTDRGFGTDPISIQNIMYKGHLNLMYGLYQMSTGDMRYAREYTWLTQQIAEEMRLHHQGIYEGVTCEPNAWFVECNTIGMLSLHIYDRLYATTYTDNEIQWSLDFIMGRMRDDETGLFYRHYQPNHDFVSPDVSGYANAWSVTFLKPFAPGAMEEIYASFKQHLTRELGPYATVNNRIGNNPRPDQVAHGFGMWAAKEFDDPALFGKLRNAIDKYLGFSVHPEHGGLVYNDPDSVMINGGMLAAKLHLGWDVVLNHDWGVEGLPHVVPDVSHMDWTDLLPQRVYALDPTGEGELPRHSAVRPCPNCFWGDYQSQRMKVEAERALERSAKVCVESAGATCGLDELGGDE